MNNKSWYKQYKTSSLSKDAGLKQIGQAAAIGLASLIPSSDANAASANKNVKAPEVQHVQPVSAPSIAPQIYNTLLRQQTIGGKIPTKMYLDTKGIPTIGIGFNLKSGQKLAENTFKSFGYNSNDIKAILNGTKAITPQQAKTLSQIAIKQHIERAKHLVPKLQTYPGYVQAAIMSAVYRGDLGRRTAQLINAGKWSQVGGQYLNNNQFRTNLNKYKNKGQRGSLGRGVAGRMQRNEMAFMQYAKQLGNKK